MIKLGVIGHPIGHSFSPDYFAQKFHREHISNASYKAFDLKNIADLPALIKKEELSGLNVTIPHKESVIPYLHEIDAGAKKIGAVNCINITHTHSGVYLKGYNTDCIGFQLSLQPLLNNMQVKAAVFGNGGAAKAVKYVLEQLHIPYIIITRDHPAMFTTEASRYVICNHTLLINTTPVGMYPNAEETLFMDYDAITEQHICYDLVYRPAQTRFLQLSAQKGATIKNGEEMLVIQAEESWKIWGSVKK